MRSAPPVILYTSRPGPISDDLGAAGFDVESRRVIATSVIPGAPERVLDALTDFAHTPAPAGVWLGLTAITGAQLLTPVGPRLRQLGVPVASCGPSTSAAARELGLEVGLEAAQPSSARTLAEAFSTIATTQGRASIVLAISAASDSWLTDTLAAQGHDVHRIDLYTTEPDDCVLDDMETRWGDYAAVIATSPSSVAALASRFEIIPDRAWVALGRKTAARVAEYHNEYRVCPSTAPESVVETVKGALT